MATTPEKQLATMLANIPDKTGKTLEAWKAIVAKAELEKHGMILKLLKTEHGVTHGFANLIAAKCLEKEASVDLVANQYEGAKQGLKPLYDAIVKHAKSLGAEVEIAPKKTSVSLRRKKQFALIVPASKSRIDLGLALKGEVANGRLEAYNAMCSHRVRLETLDSFDDEVKSWIRQAYDRAA